VRAQWTLFAITVELTDDGMNHADLVSARVFAYLGLLRTQTNWVPLWDQMRLIDQTGVLLCLCECVIHWCDGRACVR
jgi:secreted Zn-dependent insulinase-like peptidase